MAEDDMSIVGDRDDGLDTSSVAPAGAYDHNYYVENSQDRDRLALWFYERVARRLAAQRAPVLDYGSGTGWYARRLSRHFETHGLDRSAAAREAIAVNAPGVKVHAATDTVRPASMDLVTSLHVLEHIAQPATALAEIRTMLKPGGKFLCVVPDLDGWGHRIKKDRWFAYADPTHVSLLDTESWIGSLVNNGFRIDKVGTDGLWDAPYITGVPRHLQLVTIGAVAGVQVLAGRLLAPAHWGECLVIIATKR